MSPPRRRSARLASSTKTPKKAPPSNLDTLSEHDENIPPVPKAKAVESTPRKEVASTPKSSAIKPPLSAMHPSKVHPTMAPPSPGLPLGFTDIPSETKRRADKPSGITQVTPSKTPAPPSSSFTFSTSRQAVAEAPLSSRAKQMMAELREEAAKIKAELAAERDRERAAETEGTAGRKIAMPKGKSSRYSAAHMTEFKKMDSIENHPSAFRATRAQFTPVSGLKRSSSRADLDELPMSVTKRSGIKRSPSKAKLDEPDTPMLKKSQTMSSLMKKSAALQEDNPPTPAKRLKQRIEDDAASSRPVSRDGVSGIPRPKSRGADAPTPSGFGRSETVAHLLSPTKSSLARAAIKGPTISLVKSPSKLELSPIKKSATTADLKSTVASPARRILSPRGFEKVRALLKGGSKGGDDKPGSALPLPSAMSKTPGPQRVEKALPPLPAGATSPRRKLIKRPASTPDKQQDTIKVPSSPSMMSLSPSLFRSKSKSGARTPMAELHLPSVDEVMADAQGGEDVVYPNLSGFSGLSSVKEALESPTRIVSMPPPSVPGTFTFRSDHTISFDSVSPKGFGASPGQSSVRHVRSSMLPMPGSFPAAAAATVPATEAVTMDTKSGNKENKSPSRFFPGIAHGMNNKKRHRVTTDEEDAEREAEERAAKKRKNQHVPEGDALLAPRLVEKRMKMAAAATSTPPRHNAAASPVKKTPAKVSAVPRAGVQPLSRASPAKKKGISLSRLNMLARPKNRQ